MMLVQTTDAASNYEEAFSSSDISPRSVDKRSTSITPETISASHSTDLTHPRRPTTTTAAQSVTPPLVDDRRNLATEQGNVESRRQAFTEPQVYFDPRLTLIIVEEAQLSLTCHPNACTNVFTRGATQL